MEALRQQIAKACALGPKARHTTDELLSADEADPRRDLRTSLDLVNLDGLRTLRTKLASNDVIVQAYYRPFSSEREQGCLFYWLLGVRCIDDLLNREFGSEEVMKATVRTLRFWDFEVLDRETVEAILNEVIAEREQLEFLESLTGNLEAGTERDVLCAAGSESTV